MGRERGRERERERERGVGTFLGVLIAGGGRMRTP